MAVSLTRPKNELKCEVVQSEAELSIGHCAYWVSLRGMPETQNATTVSIELPRSNQFTVEALSTMIHWFGEGSFL